MENINSPDAGSNPLLDLVREQVFQDERTTEVIAGKLWRLPDQREMEWLRHQTIEQGGISTRLAQARAIMAAVVTNRGRSRPSTVRIHGTSWSWGDLPEQAKMAFEWVDAVKEARRIARGDVAQLEDPRLEPLEGIEIGDAMDAIDEMEVKPVTKPDSREREYLTLLAQAKAQ